MIRLLTFYKLPLLILLFSGMLSLGNYAQQQEFPRGVIIDSVTCLDNVKQSYTLYLPSTYDSLEELPVIYAYDAMANGRSPVELLKKAAEDFGYILVGSNSSETAPWAPLISDAKTIFKDTEARLKINPKRRYTCGFSGGAKIATALAVYYGGFAGVIGCGRGFSPNFSANFDLQFQYVEIVGDRDYNLLEMQNLDDWLDNFRIDHIFIEFHGGHEWPPADVLYKAVNWLEFRAMSVRLRERDWDRIYDYLDAENARISSLESEGREYDAYRATADLMSVMKGLPIQSKLNEKLRDLEGKPEVRKEMKARRRARELEMKYHEAYDEAFTTYKVNYLDGLTDIQSDTWWKKQLAFARNMVKNGKTPQDTLLGRRLIDYIWRNAYYNYDKMKGTELEPISKYYLEIWSLAQPDAVAPKYLLARLYTHYGKYNKAIEMMDEAIDLGFTNVDIIESDASLNDLHKIPEYQLMLERMRSLE